jgi:hypothetical protein
MRPAAAAARNASSARASARPWACGQYTLAIDYVLGVLTSYAVHFVDQRTLLIVVGDHQPAPLITAVIVRVECYAGHRGEETPRRVRFGGRAVELIELLDSWLAPDHRYFKMKAEDGATYILRNDEPSGRWELTLYEAPPRPAKRNARPR